MKLTEWRGKELFRAAGISVPRGRLARTSSDAEAAVRDGSVPLPCVVKAQVLAGGRGKGGAIRTAASPEEVRRAAEEILQLEFKGERVKELLVEERLVIDREFYLSVTLDRSQRLPLMMSSPQGGVEIETVPDESLLRQTIHPFAGLLGHEKRRVVQSFGLSGDSAKSLTLLLDAIWQIFNREDAELVEINPLALVGDRLIALDAKVIIEDDATFRHPEFAEVRDDRTPLEELAREQGIAFVQLDGNIGVIANGAGLTMATLDVLKESGGQPGVFLDLGGTDDPAKVTQAVLLMARANPRAVFLNIFGGVTRCDTVARGLVEAMDHVPVSERFPLVARIRGNREAEGIEILRQAGVTSHPDLRQAVQAVVAAARANLAPRPGAS